MTSSIFRRTLMALPGVGVSLLPKLMCPACWPAYAGIVSALGLGFLVSVKYLLPLTIAFLAITTAVLGFRASHRHGYGPFWLGVVAAVAILLAKFYFESAPAMYAGITLLIAASVWNSWPRRAARACPACIPAGAGLTKGMQKEKLYGKTQN